MKVLVTGGTGFVGSHTVAAVQAAGHQVRLLVRSPDRVARALEPLGVGDVEAMTGDVTDADSVRRALEGCDAVIHGASVYTLDVRRAAEIRETNVAGTERVLGMAAEAGLDPIVHVSSIASMFGHRGVLTPDTEPTQARGAYAASKADSERVARRFQAQGAPVVTTYPPSVWGPHDPHLGESCQIAINGLKGQFRFAMRGGMVIGDVRDVAAVHAAVLEPGRGPRRYCTPAEVMTIKEAVAALASVTGRSLKTTAMPDPVVLGMARTADALRRVAPVPAPLGAQDLYAVWDMAKIEAVDSSRTRDDLGVVGRDASESIRDTVRWLYEQGHVTAKQAGRLAEAAA